MKKIILAICTLFKYKKLCLNNAFRLSLFGRLNSWEFIILFLTAIFPLILYVKYPIYFYLIFICLFISGCLSIRDRSKSDSEIKKVYGFSWLYRGAILIQGLFPMIFLIELSNLNKLLDPINFSSYILASLAILYIFL